MRVGAEKSCCKERRYKNSKLSDERVSDFEVLDRVGDSTEGV
jgi:hypothetical protein